MVKGLKMLRHTRTEAGYFNEFLIASTPDGIENCIPPVVTAAVTAASGAEAPGTSRAFQQASVYNGMPTDFIVSAASSSADWHLQQHQQHHQLTMLYFSHPDADERQIRPAEATVAAAEIARQEVVVTTQQSRNVPQTMRHQQVDMAAGMGKMKIDLGSRESSRRPSAAPPADADADAAPSAQQQRRATRRRERNRAAAARCRRKRQDQLEGLTDVVRDLEAQNADLEGRVAGLLATRSDLLRRLREHRLACPDGPAAFAPADCGAVPLDTDLASLATATSSGEEILLTPSLLLPPPLPIGGDFKLEPL